MLTHMATRLASTHQSGVVYGTRRPADARDEHVPGSGPQRHRPQALRDERLPSCGWESGRVSDGLSASVQPDSVSTASEECRPVRGGSRRRAGTDVRLDAQPANPDVGRLSVHASTSPPLNPMECGIEDLGHGVGHPSSRCRRSKHRTD